MSKLNKWWVIGKEDKNNPYGYSQLTPKGEFYSCPKEVRKTLKEMRKIYNTFECKVKLVILERTCRVIK